MPLPLPNLDTRRWSDLIDEGRGLIPRYAPGWTDHNVHDPGITLVELLAWLVEQDIYRVDRVPIAHRRKFLALLGFDPAPPLAALAPLTLALKPGPSAADLGLPAGVMFAAQLPGGAMTPFRTVAPLTVAAATLSAVQVADGLGAIDDVTRRWQSGLPFAALGPDPHTDVDPERQSALYLGFRIAGVPDAGRKLDLWLRFAGTGRGEPERRRILGEAAAQADACRPQQPRTACLGDGGGSAPEPSVELPPHHSARMVWELFAGGGWRALDPALAEVVDETRSLTLDGQVRLTLPVEPAARAVGGVADELVYVRCRLDSGRHDAAPVLVDVALNTVAAEQRTAARSRLTIARRTPPGGPDLTPGSTGRLSLTLDADGSVTEFAFGQDVQGPGVTVLDYVAADAENSARLTTTLALAGWGSGLPGQTVVLGGAPIADGAAEIWTTRQDGATGDNGMLAWRRRRDLDASTATDADFVLDAVTGEVRFGNGEHGRVVPADAAILAVYDTTAGAAGNVRAGVDWVLDGADDVSNAAVLEAVGMGPLADVDAALAPAVNRVGASGGSDEEDVEQAAGRAAEALWSHERLVELAASRVRPTLDQIDRAQVLARAAPPRAVTVPDYERLALDVPGTVVARARAWPALDPALPCLEAAGTLTVLVLPQLPKGRPKPTDGLLVAVRRYLGRRRLVGTRLVVAAPTYVEVSVTTTVQAKPGAVAARVTTDVVAALDALLDPLTGGPDGLGWPFGRDVYRSEILQAIDRTAGVDHVLSLEVTAGGSAAPCANVCVPATALAASGTHEVTVQ
jgi:hypothetical protein